MVTSQPQQNAFLADLSEAVSALGESASDADKNRVLQTHLLDAWQKVLPNFGYSGDEGYVSFQAALVEHSTDSDVAAMINSALMSVATHAGLRR